jgi:hypothetical protein
MRLKTDVDNTGRETQEYNMRPEREAALMPSLKWWSESRKLEQGQKKADSLSHRVEVDVETPTAAALICWKEPWVQVMWLLSVGKDNNGQAKARDACV